MIVGAEGVVPFALKPSQTISVEGRILEEGVDYRESDGVGVDVLFSVKLQSEIILMDVVGDVVQVVGSISVIPVLLAPSPAVIVPIALEGP